MLQIKTIHDTDPAAFDEAVNTALMEGWTLTRRLTGPEGNAPGFVAELEQEIITEAERCCENCRHYDSLPHTEPCRSCGENADKWEAAT